MGSKVPSAIPMYELILSPPLDVPVVKDHSLDKRMTLPVVELEGYAGVSRKTIERVDRIMKFLRIENMRLKEALKLQQTKKESNQMQTTKTTAAKKKAPLVKKKKVAAKKTGSKITAQLQTAKKAARKTVAKVSRARKAN